MNIDDIPNLVNVIQSTVKKKTNKDPTIRIIKQENKNKSKNKFTRKKPSKVKDINEIEMKIENKKKKEKENLVKQMKNLSKEEKPK